LLIAYKLITCHNDPKGRRSVDDVSLTAYGFPKHYLLYQGTSYIYSIDKEIRILSFPIPIQILIATECGVEDTQRPIVKQLSVVLHYTSSLFSSYDMVTCEQAEWHDRQALRVDYCSALIQRLSIGLLYQYRKGRRAMQAGMTN